MVEFVGQMCYSIVELVWASYAHFNADQSTEDKFLCQKEQNLWQYLTPSQ